MTYRQSGTCCLTRDPSSCLPCSTSQWGPGGPQAGSSPGSRSRLAGRRSAPAGGRTRAGGLKYFQCQVKQTCRRRKKYIVQRNLSTFTYTKSNSTFTFNKFLNGPSFFSRLGLSERCKEITHSCGKMRKISLFE